MVQQSVLYNPVHGLSVIDSGGVECCGKTGIGADAGIGVDFQNPGFSGIVHTEIDPGISS